MSDGPRTTFPSEETIFRLRAKMEDYEHSRLTEDERGLIAFRVPGDSIELLKVLEYLSELLNPEQLEGVEKVVIISDKNNEVTPANMMVPKLETKKEDDERLFHELKTKLNNRLQPLVFTVENDILEIYRTAIRMDGSMDRTDSSVGLDLLKVDLPREGELIYLIFDDGYRKMRKSRVEEMVDRAMEDLRHGPNLVKPPKVEKQEKEGPVGSIRSKAKKDVPKPAESRTGIEASGPSKPGPSETISNEWKRPSVGGKPPGSSFDPDMIMKDFSRKAVSLGYRRDTNFSRNDAHQIFMVGLNGPTVFFKVLEEGEDPGAFLRVLNHRKDAMGILITREWSPQLEALSRLRGFLYLDENRCCRAHEVLKDIIKGEIS